MTLTIDLPEDQVQALKIRAEARGVSAEQYARQVLEHDLVPSQPISGMMREIWADMPEAVRAKLPRDGASQVDHYIYGLPKRDT
ncbi:MAG TPA: hypothetical protein VG297_02680 [Bryobacteraceae bacterium]|jgi:hypothetical protein|nr:hypothetical protein [Bryobacteraceae bacterium]